MFGRLRQSRPAKLAVFALGALALAFSAAPEPGSVAAAATAPPVPAAQLSPPSATTFVPNTDETPAPGPPTPHITPPANGTDVEPFTGASSSAQTPPPLSATATPHPSGELVRYSGQLLDVRRGFVFFTTGDAFRLANGSKVRNAAGTGPTTLLPKTRVYARATFDKGDGTIVQLDLSQTKLPAEASYETIAGFKVAFSTPAPNPDLGHGAGLNGKPVLVTFKVRVPPRTPFSDDVFLATSASNWSATEIRMSRIDALNYEVSREFPSGTVFEYRYTRGSWNSAERGQDGLEDTRKLSVGNGDTQNKSDVVYHWGDENNGAPDLGGGIPTPFQAIPFVLPPHK